MAVYLVVDVFACQRGDGCSGWVVQMELAKDLLLGGSNPGVGVTLPRFATTVTIERFRTGSHWFDANCTYDVVDPDLFLRVTVLTYTPL